MPRIQKMEEYIRLFIKTIMGNSIPIVWLFMLQPLWNIQFDGVGFWSVYAGFSILFAIVLWLTNRTIPDPSYMTVDEIATPVRGVVAAAFQFIIFFSILGVYFNVK